MGNVDGFCTSDADNSDVTEGEIKISGFAWLKGEAGAEFPQSHCLTLCRNFPGAVACELKADGCYAHTTFGPGIKGISSGSVSNPSEKCWVLGKCKGLF